MTDVPKASTKYEIEKKRRFALMCSYLPSIEQVRFIKDQFQRMDWVCFTTHCKDCELSHGSCPNMKWRALDINRFEPLRKDPHANGRITTNRDHKEVGKEYKRMALERGYITQEEYDEMIKE